MALEASPEGRLQQLLDQFGKPMHPQSQRPPRRQKHQERMSIGYYLAAKQKMEQDRDPSKRVAEAKAKEERKIRHEKNLRVVPDVFTPSDYMLSDT